MNKEEKYWYAIYTKPRWEKKVHELLERRGVESYCPLNKVKKKWSDRYKTIEEPLFKSYLFVHVNEADKGNVRFVDGVVNYVYWLGKPAVVKTSDIEQIQRFLKEYKDISVEPLMIEPGQRVRVTSGLLMDHTATVLSVNKNSAELRIESLQCKLVAKVDKSSLQYA